LVLKFFNINIPKDQIFQRKKNTPIRPASLDDLTATKEVIFANLRAFVSPLCSGFLCCSGKQGWKEAIKTREESNTHHSSKDNKIFLRVPKPIATKPTDRENNSSEHRPIKRFMGMSERRKLTRIATHLKWSSSGSMREKTRQEIGDLGGEEDDQRHKTLSQATLQPAGAAAAEPPPRVPSPDNPPPCPRFRRATL
jgi:hypothetical protein